MRRFAFLVAVLGLVCGCGNLYPDAEIQPGDKVSLTVNVGTGTKSEYAPDESAVKDMNILVFGSDGLLFMRRYEIGSVRSVTLELKSGAEYSVFAVANWGSALEFLSIADASAWMIHWPDFQKDGAMLMIGDTTVLPVGSCASTFIMLDRVASKVSFRVDDSALGHVEIRSARICQAADRMFPFVSGNRAEGEYAVADGDRATSSDLELLNSGGEICFYVLENMQGVLLPGNSDPWEKVPDNLGTNAGLCTYVEVEGSFDGVSSIFSGDVIYRFYLGRDNCADFNLERNTDYRIFLIMSTNLDAVSWKIESDANLVSEGHGWGYISEGRQASLSSLYAGEWFRYAVSADDALSAYFGGNLGSASLVAFDAQGSRNRAIQFGKLRLVDGKWVADVSCITPASGLEIWLYDTLRLRKVQKLSSGVRVEMPAAVISASQVAEGGTVNAASSLPLILNGAAKNVWVYFVDGHGSNLCGRWFDNTVFFGSVKFGSRNPSYEGILGCFKASVSFLQKGLPMYAACNLKASYSGSPLSAGYVLSELCSETQPGIGLGFSAGGIDISVPVKLAAQPISLDYDCIARKVSVNNPSLLPLKLSCYDYTWFGPGELDYTGITKDTVDEYRYSEQGKTYSACRLDCVNYTDQCFGYCDVADTDVQNGTYDLSGVLLDYYSAYSLFGYHNCADSKPLTFSVFDVSLRGRNSLFPVGKLSTKTAPHRYSSDAFGTHEGVVLFSAGIFAGGSSGVASFPGYDALARANGALVYSPSLLESSLRSPGAFETGVRNCSTGPNAGSTEFLVMRLYGNCDVRIDMTLRQTAALRTLPNGYGDNLFVKYSYFWKSPYETASAASHLNPGNSRMSYTYRPGTSAAINVSGTFGSDKFTASNYGRNASLSYGYSAVLHPGADPVAVMPLMKFINENIFTMKENDSSKSSGKTPTYAHRYHPGECHIEAVAKTVAPDALFKCVAPDLFTGEMRYFNSGYEGFYTWVFRDVSSPFNATQLEMYNAGSNCDMYTTWYFRNRNPQPKLRTGSCIRVCR